ncbi:MAG: M24 family metallopeptidase, partial [Aeromicrobium erythreum]
MLCTSVNDAGPARSPATAYRLKDGDLVSFDFACSVDGWVGDSAVSIVVGTPPPRRTSPSSPPPRRRLAAGIDAARAGNRLGDISAAIGGVARSHGLLVNTQFGGHSVGRTMHGDLHPAERRPGRPRRPARPGPGRGHRAVVPAVDRR